MSDENKTMVFEKKATTAIEELNKAASALREGLESKADNSTIEKIQDAIDKVELQLKQGQNIIETKNGLNRDEAEFKMVSNYLRKGIVTEDLEAKSDLSTDFNKFGGYVLGTQMSDSILRRQREFSPVREIAAHQTISKANVWEEPIEGEDEYDTGWVGERQSRPSTDVGDIKLVKIPLHEVYAQPKFTRRIITDTRIDMESFMIEKLRERFDRVEGQAFITGDGNQKPLGFLFNTATVTSSGDKTSQGIEAQVAALSFDGIMDLVYSLEAPYHANAMLTAHRLTLRNIRKLKDSEGQYLWQPSMSNGQPSTILEYKYKMMTDMPTPASGAFSLAFGDWKQGYKVVDGEEFYTIRDEVTVKPFILYYTIKRVGGGILMDKALKFLKQS